MVNEKSTGAVSQPNGELNNGVIQTFPGGKQSILPEEPQSSEGLFLNT